MEHLFIRSKHNPILRPEGSEWWKIYNPGAALDTDGTVHLFPRVMKQEADWHSLIAHATLEDGEHFTWDSEPMLVRSGLHEQRGLEDPRVVRIGGEWHMTFAVYDGKSVQLHSAGRRVGRAVAPARTYGAGFRFFQKRR
ncbi:MAG: hypothetical protein ACREGH_01385 [Minisyncoccia bacterium]